MIPLGLPVQSPFILMVTALVLVQVTMLLRYGTLELTDYCSIIKVNPLTINITCTCVSFIF